jgi:CPA2 family monovalent cation:H+ antiporter-2
MTGTELLELGGVVVALALLARFAGRFGIPAVPLYLLGGLAFGSGGLLTLVRSEAFIRTGAEIGLILLLFMLGLEYSSRELVDGLRRTWWAATIDIVLNFAPGLVAGFLLGWAPLPSVLLGGVTLVSSSGIVAKTLQDLRWSTRPEGSLVISILVAEDLVMAVYLALLTGALSGESVVAAVLTGLVAFAAVSLTLLAALRFDAGVSRFLFSRSDEVLVLTILGVALLVAGAGETLHISAAVGAFLAGIILSGPAAERASDVLGPIRDVFAALFFAFIGLSTDPSVLLQAIGLAVALAVVTAATKVATGWLAARHAGMPAGARWRAGALLVPRAEFSLIVAGLGGAAQLEPRLVPLSVGYVMILAVLGPIGVRVTDHLLRRAGPAGAPRPSS